VSRVGAREQTTGEEIANSVTHGIGAGLAAAGLSVLVTLAAMQGDPWRVVSFSIYGATLVLLYLASTLYHGFRGPRVKRVFQTLDHSAIFLLIAGTYTPFSLVTLRGPWGWTLFGLIWGLAVTGIVLQAVAPDRYRIAQVLLYVGMGWLALIAIKPLIESLPAGGMAWLVAGGMSYTLGVGFYAWKRLRFAHAIWHLFVLGGSVCHFFCMILHVLPG
jgi:hemolysin III